MKLFKKKTVNESLYEALIKFVNTSHWEMVDYEFYEEMQKKYTHNDIVRTNDFIEYLQKKFEDYEVDKAIKHKKAQEKFQSEVMTND